MTITSHDTVEVLDLVVIGAGVSGIGAARYFTESFPSRKVVVLESRANIGGTWDLFRYPGIRSDSDLHTYGYEFKPWLHKSAIAEGDLIRDYLQEAADELDLTPLIRVGHRVVAASWSSADALWTLQLIVTDESGRQVDSTIKTRWVFGATGYYNYAEGYTPEFKGREDFAGDIIHPQHWPEGFDYGDKRVVVIGSGATAVTLTPALLMGDRPAAHVTMLQRTPSYVMSLPRVDGLALTLTKWLGADRGYALTRLKNIWLDHVIVKTVRTFPRLGRAAIRRYTEKELPAGFDVDKHFNPPYAPWDQRLCVTPDGEFFAAIREGQASVVTDRIVRFTETGLLLESGQTLEADIIVTATGLNMQMFGGIPLTVDGVPVAPRDTVTYRGVLFSQLPNWAVMLGYTKSSWTLRISNVCGFVCDLIREMDLHGHDYVVPVFPEGAPTKDLLDLTSGYMQRSVNELPRQGTEMPWVMRTQYIPDTKLFKKTHTTEHLRFGSHTPATPDARAPKGRRKRASGPAARPRATSAGTQTEVQA